MSVAFLLYVAVFLCIPVFSAVYVYRDANRNRMNAPLWTLLAILAPMMGLIIYLLVRDDHFNLR